mmetsp:Transcript_52118/g.102849  ORF Transcript_52118/g.102849 Transcript_52118/m.102849 type:complete len:217 (-) Transcript_52118:14-664(-)
MAAAHPRLSAAQRQKQTSGARASAQADAGRSMRANPRRKRAQHDTQAPRLVQTPHRPNPGQPRKRRCRCSKSDILAAHPEMKPSGICRRCQKDRRTSLWFRSRRCDAMVRQSPNHSLTPSPSEHPRKGRTWALPRLSGPHYVGHAVHRFATQLRPSSRLRQPDGRSLRTTAESGQHPLQLCISAIWRRNATTAPRVSTASVAQTPGPVGNVSIPRM